MRVVSRVEKDGSGLGIHSLLERLIIQDPLSTTHHAVSLSMGYKPSGTNWRIASKFHLVDVEIKVQQEWLDHWV